MLEIGYASVSLWKPEEKKYAGLTYLSYKREVDYKTTVQVHSF